MRMKKDNDITGAGLTVHAILFYGLLFALLCTARAQTRVATVEEETPRPAPRVMQAKTPYEGGVKEKIVKLDEGYLVIIYNSGAVETNTLKFANTPLQYRPVIESELRKNDIVNAALTRFEGNNTTRLQLAAEEARATLERTVEGSGRDVIVARETPALEMKNDLPPSGDGGIIETPATRETTREVMTND